MSSVRVRVRARKSESRPLGLVVACKMDISDLSFSRQQLAADPNLIERQIAACDGNDSRIQAVRRLIMVGVRAIQPALHASLVDTVLKLPWRESQGLCESVLDFCLELVSAVPAFNKPSRLPSKLCRR